MTDDDPCFRDQPLEQIADREDRFDAIVDEVDLAAPSQLVPDRPLDHRRVELDDVRLNRQPVLGWRLDDRHVANADERHVQRPRNRRRGHRQHVDALAHLLDALLVRDAEALLLVDDEQAQIFELHVLRQQPMRADDDVDLARRQVVENHFGLLLGPEAADHVDRHREAGKPIAQRLQVLKRQHRRRGEKRRPVCRP